MPSFPTSVFAPPSRSAGQTVQPAHMNDAQDELNAIEGGYLNGTARLNSSASTLASLSVAGGSTLAGRLAVSSGLSVAGNSTLGSSVTLGTIPYVFPSSGGSTGQVLTCVSTSGSTMTLEWRASAGGGSTAVPDAVKGMRETILEIATGSSVGIAWTEQTFITNSSMHSTATNPTRLTPQSTGIYLVTVFVNFRTLTGSFYDIRIKDSSNAIIGWGTSSLAHNLLNLSTYKRFDELGGYVRVSAEVGGTTNALSTRTWATMVKL